MHAGDHPAERAYQPEYDRAEERAVNDNKLKALGPIPHGIMQYEKLVEQLAAAVDLLESVVQPVRSERDEKSETVPVNPQPGNSKTANSLNGLNDRLMHTTARLRRITGELEI